MPVDALARQARELEQVVDEGPEFAACLRLAVQQFARFGGQGRAVVGLDYPARRDDRAKRRPEVVAHVVGEALERFVRRRQLGRALPHASLQLVLRLFEPLHEQGVLVGHRRLGREGLHEPRVLFGEPPRFGMPEKKPSEDLAGARGNRRREVAPDGQMTRRNASPLRQRAVAGILGHVVGQDRPEPFKGRREERGRPYERIGGERLTGNAREDVEAEPIGSLGGGVVEERAELRADRLGRRVGQRLDHLSGRESGAEHPPRCGSWIRASRVGVASRSRLAS